MRSLLRLLLTVFVLTTEVLALEPGEILKDPALEARARSISKNLRCLVCQNQSIDESNSELAKDLKILIRFIIKRHRGKIFHFLYFNEHSMPMCEHK